MTSTDDTSESSIGEILCVNIEINDTWSTNIFKYILL